MTKTVNIHHAKTHLSRLLDDVRKGQEFVIAKAGKPIARVVPVTAAPGQRRPGSAIGQLVLSEDFDAPLPKELLKAFGK
jgi:prevent-host-death family protein